MYGVDCSEHQGVIDWETARPHIGFAIIRASGYGWERADYQFVRNQAECRRLGIPRGYYYFAGLGDSVQQADRFADIVGPLEPGESVWLDWEADVMSLGEGWAIAFLRRCLAHFGAIPGIYMSAFPASSGWDQVRAEGYPLWVAAYNSYGPWHGTGDPGWPVAIWQNTSTDRVPGISGSVDGNISYVDFAALGMGGLQKEEPEMAFDTVPMTASQERTKFHGHYDNTYTGVKECWILVEVPQAEEAGKPWPFETVTATVYKTQGQEPDFEKVGVFYIAVGDDLGIQIPDVYNGAVEVDISPPGAASCYIRTVI